MIATDGPFGNLVTNVDADDFLKLGYQRGQTVPVTVGGKEMKMQVCEDVQRCAAGPAAALHRFARASGLAVNQNSFAATYGDQAAGGRC